MEQREEQYRISLESQSRQLEQRFEEERETLRQKLEERLSAESAEVVRESQKRLEARIAEIEREKKAEVEEATQRLRSEFAVQRSSMLEQQRATRAELDEKSKTCERLQRERSALEGVQADLDNLRAAVDAFEHQMLDLARCIRDEKLSRAKLQTIADRLIDEMLSVKNDRTFLNVRTNVLLLEWNSFSSDGCQHFVHCPPTSKFSSLRIFVICLRAALKPH